MFKKLLSNLPFNPSLIGQVSFYAKRLHSETAFRRAGLITLSLAVTLQVFAVISPPQPSVARSNSDMITGGFTSQSEAKSYCDKDVRDYRKILSYYGITCDDISHTSTVSISPNDYNKQLYSMGHLAYGVTGEVPADIPNVGTLYLRHFWSLNKADSYKALKGTTNYGTPFFILYTCGNLVFIDIPTPPKVCPYNHDILASDPKCFEPCPIQGKSNIPKKSKECVAPCPYNRSIPANDPKCFEPCPVSGKSGIPRTSPDCFEPCQYNSVISRNNPNCKPCQASQTQEDLTACLQYRKGARNITENTPDANGTQAKAGDAIEYTLSTTNQGKATIKGYVVNENISDVLDYADVVDLHGGSINDDNVVSWPKQDIKAGATLTQKITVKIKNPIPSTPASASDPAHFDLTMTNVYGNTVDIKLPASVVKTTEVVVTKLPNTGPGTSVAIAFIATAFFGYLFARSHLFAKELSIVVNDFVETGGPGK